mgnify:CR=1 FL=1
MNKIDLNLLPIVIALYDESSVSRAAQVLGMSQPAVSMALRKLRVAYHDPLFVRVRNGITPTPRAHALGARGTPSRSTPATFGALARPHCVALRSAAPLRRGERR